jgi:hypothetical protein
MVRRIKVVSYGFLCFLAGAALVLLAGANGTQETPVSRYQVAATNGNAFVLDTQTGQLWARPGITDVNYDLGTLENPTIKLIQPASRVGLQPAADDRVKTSQ